MHPLLGNIGALKDAELESKINDLSKKYFMTSNPGVKAQIASALHDYRSELSNRNQAALRKMMDNRDKGLDKLINVN